MKRWDSLMELYLVERQACGISDAAVISCRQELGRWGLWLKSRKPKPTLEEITVEQHQAYIRSRTQFKSRSTTCGVISKMRNFGEYLLRQGVWVINHLKWMKSPKLDFRRQIPSRISREQMEKLWSTAATIGKNYLRSLNLVILALLYGTGLRRGEACRLKVTDWDRQEGVLKIDGQKTGRERKVPLPESTWKFLEAYLPIRHNHLARKGLATEEALLIGLRGRPLSGNQLSHTLACLSRRAGIDVVRLHQFRHSCASDLLEAGISLPQVKEILGHSTILSTYRYTRIASPELVKAIRKHPINGFLGTQSSEEAAHA